MIKSLIKDLLKEVEDPVVKQNIYDGMAPILKFILLYFAPYFLILTTLLTVIILLLISLIYYKSCS